VGVVLPFASVGEKKNKSRRERRAEVAMVDVFPTPDKALRSYHASFWGSRIDEGA